MKIQTLILIFLSRTICGMGKGCVEKLMKGKKADFIAVRGDPMQDVSLLRPENVVLVVKNGKVEKNTLNQ